MAKSIAEILALIKAGKEPTSRRAIKQYEVKLVRLDRGGYDRHGRYFGVGGKLYQVFDNDSGRSLHVRASSAKKARELAIANPQHWGGWR